MAIERRLTGEPVELDPLLGSSLSGRYLLRELIERQGALRWYHAEIEQEERAVLATYVDLAGVAGGDADAGVDPAIAERFAARVEQLRELDPTTWTELLDAGQHKGGLFVIERGSSWHHLGRELALKGRLSAPQAVGIADQLLAGLTALHIRGLSYDALVPWAVQLWLGADGLQTAKLSSAVAAAGGVLPPDRRVAMLPELAAKNGAGADLKAVAALLTQMITGHAPVDAADALAALESDKRVPASVRRVVGPLLGRRAAGSRVTASPPKTAEGLRRALASSTDAASFGRYTLVRRLALGGMGEILLAQVEEIAGISRPCVIKTIRPQLAGEADFVDRFVAEARVVASLHHGNIVPVYDVGKVADSIYIAMEYVAGKDLHQVMQTLGGKPLPLPLTLFIARELANGLAYAHRAKVHGMGQLVHRDVSPQNVLLSYDGEVKLIDFGLARTDRGSATGDGVVVGKLRYMAPEQACGQPVDQRTDIYALGLVLFEMLTGEAFFHQETTEQLMALVAAPLIHPPSSRAEGVPKELDRICLEAMSPDPQRRYASASELRDDLSAALAKIAPRTNQEQVGDLLRQLFADDVEADENPLAGSSAAPAELLDRSSTTGKLEGASLLGSAPTPIQLIPTQLALGEQPTLSASAAGLEVAPRRASPAALAASRSAAARVAFIEEPTVLDHSADLAPTDESARPPSAAVLEAARRSGEDPEDLMPTNEQVRPPPRAAPTASGAPPVGGASPVGSAPPVGSVPTVPAKPLREPSAPPVDQAVDEAVAVARAPAEDSATSFEDDRPTRDRPSIDGSISGGQPVGASPSQLSASQSSVTMMLGNKRRGLSLWSLLRLLLITAGVAAVVVIGLVLALDRLAPRKKAPVSREPGALGISVATRRDARAAADVGPADAGSMGDGAVADGAAGEARAAAAAGQALCYLEVKGGLAGMKIFIDGKHRATVPVSRPIPLLARRKHSVVVRKRGFHALRRLLRAPDCGPGMHAELPLHVR